MLHVMGWRGVALGGMGHFVGVCGGRGGACREGDGDDHGEVLHFEGAGLTWGFARVDKRGGRSFGLRVEGSGVEWSAVAGPRGTGPGRPAGPS